MGLHGRSLKRGNSPFYDATTPTRQQSCHRRVSGRRAAARQSEKLQCIERCCHDPRSDSGGGVCASPILLQLQLA